MSLKSQDSLDVHQSDKVFCKGSFSWNRRKVASFHESLPFSILSNSSVLLLFFNQSGRYWHQTRHFLRTFYRFQVSLFMDNRKCLQESEACFETTADARSYIGGRAATNTLTTSYDIDSISSADEPTVSSPDYTYIAAAAGMLLYRQWGWFGDVDCKLVPVATVTNSPCIGFSPLDDTCQFFRGNKLLENCSALYKQ